MIIPSLVLAALVGVGSHTVGTVYAQESDSIPTRVQEIADRFNLNVNEVSDFFKEKRKARMVERQAAREEALNTAVSEGKITEEQKNTLLARMEENRPDREAMQNLSMEERQAQREEHKAGMEAWAEENGIDLSNLNLGRKGFGGGRRFNKGI